jgi:ABC-type transporter Mla subunit MlaD
MAAQGLTGAFYLELDYVDPTRNPPLPIAWTPEHLYIPSARSTVGQLMSGAENLMRKLDRANLGEVVINLNQMVTEVRHALESAHPGELSSNADAMLTEIRETNRRLQVLISDPAWRSLPREAAAAVNDTRKLVANEDLTKAVAQLRQTLDSTEHAVQRLDRTVAAREAELPVILDNLRQTTESLRDLTENLRRYPSSAVLGEPPRPLTLPAPARKP